MEIEDNGLGARHGFDRIADSLGPKPGTLHPDKRKMIGTALCFPIHLDRSHVKTRRDPEGLIETLRKNRSLQAIFGIVRNLDRFVDRFHA